MKEYNYQKVEKLIIETREMIGPFHILELNAHRQELMALLIQNHDELVTPQKRMKFHQTLIEHELFKIDDDIEFIVAYILSKASKVQEMEK